MENIIYLIPALPLIGFIICGIFGKKMSEKMVGGIATLMVFISFLLSIIIFGNLCISSSLDNYDPIKQNLFNWFTIGEFKVNFAFQIDQLSIIMMMIVTGVGFLIHLYSIGYMHGDKGFYKFFSYLNLFIFSMLLLVMGSNFLILFIGWEGVGFCSYLLIGFWFKNKEYGYAARKAFVMNRIGDLGLLIGIFIIAYYFGSIEYTDIVGKINNFSINDPILISATIFLFIGAMGKSAQIPLYTWLPDAMAGPTPVSALIHAATMVTAGIYMVIRSNAIYSLSPFTLDFIMYVGLATSLLAAFIGLRQNDIKKVLAYSTVSQLGLMFIAIGAGAYTTALFHVTTHAFFKALLFLGAGSVIHAMSGEQDMRYMGGLKKKIPLTYGTFLIGTLAICGVPPLAGMFSKDEILTVLWGKNKIVWFLTLFSAALTCIYMFRLLFLTFFGDFKGTKEQKEHIHESPAVMTIPLIILAILTTIGGAINLPHYLGESISQKMANWLSVIYIGLHPIPEPSFMTEMILLIITLTIIAIVAGFSYHKYVKLKTTAQITENLIGWQKVSAKAAYVNELYNEIIVNPILNLGRFLKNIVDKYFINGIVEGVGKLIQGCGNILRLVQNGNVEFYVFAMSVGIFILLLVAKFLTH
ncbi:NADH-quinone oxidoreductase subunit L [Apibacter adventoris]|uniref:NADH-quinone oxidoreductase subunit L n=1 Tax=Apibacter adventoris TaxID=1679466 RepID=A0A2S8AGL7_9FLAO|nr:NADH-quinone oxidoreductase subunit L [Apibacter adventoris]PQL95520.1 NADH-quinone oxidoreductase subunit L [Apibacter adventoris]